MAAGEDAEGDAVEELAVGDDRAADLVDDAGAGVGRFGDVHTARTGAGPKSVVGGGDVAGQEAPDRGSSESDRNA
ncbi:hypothetical protein GCM10009060_18970 [Halorubrum trapanicum]